VPPSNSSSAAAEALAAAGLDTTDATACSASRIKKRPISGTIGSSDVDSDLTCPICFDLIDIAHVTKCGHSFCQSCIQTALEHTHRCPKCNTPCNINKDVFPNFTLNQIVEKFKEDTNSKKFKASQQTPAMTILECLNASSDDLRLEDLDQLLKMLLQRQEELKLTNKKVSELLLHDFLKHLQQTKTEELNKIQYELQLINEDCKQVEDCLDTMHEKGKDLMKLSTNDECKITATNEVTAATGTSSKDELAAPTTDAIDLSPTHKMQSLLLKRKRILHRYFDELNQSYIQAHNKDWKDLNIKDTSQSVVLDQLRTTVSKMTTYSEIRCLASVNYNSDLYSMSSIVSSVDFDKTYEHFAMAGVTKRIKIFNFANILAKPSGVHYPLYEMTHNAKISCVSWNRYFRHQLVCSDYEGCVTLWDAEAGSLVRSYQEHEKRCWGVSFCDVDPRLIASGSDDSKVKIWSTNSDYSLLSIDAKSNVCCVVFKPDSKFHVLFGTADHNVHYYDIRNPKEPVALFRGHKKAVSYVKFRGGDNSNEFISASTDSTLKMWKINEGQCVRTFTGHVNEKNFVGLETHDGYIVTGSENNTVYMYCTDLSKPLLTYKFDEGATAKRDEGVNDFVSAVCWSNQNYLLAANSQGVVKVLELVK